MSWLKRIFKEAKKPIEWIEIKLPKLPFHKDKEDEEEGKEEEE